MSRETAHKVIERAYEEGPSYCVFGFQGGEPALAGLSFFGILQRMPGNEDLKGQNSLLPCRRTDWN